MRVVTIVSLGACALFGLSALVVAKTMMPNPGAAKAAAPQVMAGVPIVVAKGALKFGDKLDASKIEILKIPSNAVPDGAFTTVAQVLAQDGGGAPVALDPDRRPRAAAAGQAFRSRRPRFGRRRDP